MEIFLRASTLAELSPLEGGSFKGVIFGAEFCPFRLPKISEVEEARLICAENGLAFTLSTPLLRQAHFNFTSKWLREALKEGEEWSANDWGLLFWAKNEGFENPVNAGRLLGKQRRDSRTVEMVRGASTEEARALGGSLWDEAADVALARGLGVTGFELDCLLQGAGRPATGENSRLILCGPHIAVTVTPACPWNDKMLHSPESCSYPCRAFPPAIITNSQRPEPLFCSGNAQFLDCGMEFFLSEAKRLGASRAALSAAIPA